jgi:hypothetical protein
MMTTPSHSQVGASERSASGRPSLHHPRKWLPTSQVRSEVRKLVTGILGIDPRHPLYYFLTFGAPHPMGSRNSLLPSALMITASRDFGSFSVSPSLNASAMPPRRFPQNSPYSMSTPPHP